MKNLKFEPPIPTEKDISDFHCVEIQLYRVVADVTLKCSICNRDMKRAGYNLFICDPNTRTAPKKECSHYHQHKPEAIDLIEKYQLNFSEGCFVKYMLRCEFKGDKLGDLKKALYYLKRCKMPSFRRAISYADLSDYYNSNIIFKSYVDKVLSFISGHSFGTIKVFLEHEICKLENKNNGS